DHRELHAFPTRRSSDLVGKKGVHPENGDGLKVDAHRRHTDKDVRLRNWKIELVERFQIEVVVQLDVDRVEISRYQRRVVKLNQRSEEHTSELQSRENLV